MRFAVVIVAVVAVLLVVAYTAEAKQCVINRSPQLWKHARGNFKKIRGTQRWVEINEQGMETTQFVEFHRQNNQVILHDASRDLKVLLQDGLAAVQNQGENQFRQIYEGNWEKVVDCT